MFSYVYLVIMFSCCWICIYVSSVDCRKIKFLPLLLR